MKGGNLCDEYNDKVGEDIYSLDENPFPGIYTDKKNKSLLIKKINDKEEFKLAKLLHNNDFVPKVYGYFDCKKNIKVPQYSAAQQRLNAYNKFHPGDIQDIGEIKYTTHIENIKYMVMQRIDGNSLMSYSKDIIEMYIDEIYRFYNILADKGYILNDLAARNIILSNNGKIYFIDFDPHFTKNTLSSIKLSKRVSKEALLEMLKKEVERNGGKPKKTNKNKKTNKKIKQTQQKNNKT
jgi:predicted Ser/Thr protein kinase